MVQEWGNRKGETKNEEMGNGAWKWEHTLFLTEERCLSQ